MDPHAQKPPEATHWACYAEMTLMVFYHHKDVTCWCRQVFGDAHMIMAVILTGVTGKITAGVNTNKGLWAFSELQQGDIDLGQRLFSILR